MRRSVLGLGMLALAAIGTAQLVTDADGNTVAIFKTRDAALSRNEIAASQPNLTYHGGPVIVAATQVSIFWGTEWGTTNSPSALATSMMAFFASFGTTPEYNTITQYSGITKNNLTNAFWVDTVNPPVNVTDKKLKAEVKKYLNTFTGGIANPSTIYEVFLPSTSYSSMGGSNSCGGPNLQFCAYHGHFSFNGVDVKYASLPYPSCSGCQWPGFTVEHNLDHFACHETREAVTDEDLNAWFDRNGAEADDKCAWSPAPFIGTGGFGYQWEWSNLDHACVQTK